jgi:hypothetical protein
LPAQSPAHAAALATTVLAALQALALHAACRAWGARPVAASAAVVLFAAGPIAMRIHTEAEVFALNGLVVATIVWLAAEAAPLRGLRRVVALTLVAGLGLSNHVTCVLVAPIGILGVVRGIREAGGSRARGIVAGLLAFCVGLTPYLYLLVAPQTEVSWGKIGDLHALVRHILREDYGGPLQFSPRGEAVPITDNLAAFAASLGHAYLYLPALVGLGALAYFSARSDRRWAWSLYAASWLLAGPLLVLRFNLKPDDLGLYVVQRFHLLPMGLLAVPVAVGLDRLGARVRVPERLRGSRAVHGVLVVAGFAAAAGSSLSFVRRGHSPAIEQALVNELVTLPPGAIVIGAPDDLHFGMQYLQGALGLRPDVAIIVTPQIGLVHYRERVRRKTGIVIEKAAEGEKLSVKIAEQALATGRPVFIDPYQANIATSLPTYPYGILFRVLPAGTPLPSLEELFAINKHVFELYQFGYERPGTRDQLATKFHDHYARVWRILGQALGRAGLREEEAFAWEMMNALEPKDR